MIAKRIFWTSFLSILMFSAMANQTGKVVRVWDGDSFNLLVKGKVISTRLANIDAPEMNQAWGKESQKNVSQLILGKDVEFDSLGLDKYKRELVMIYVKGERLDSLLISNGWAWHYVNYSNDVMLAKCQTIAVEKKLGLWQCGAKGVCPPWLFRQYNYRNKMKYCKGCSK